MNEELNWRAWDENTIAYDGVRYAIQLSDGSITDAVAEVHGPEEVSFIDDDGNDLEPVRIARIE